MKENLMELFEAHQLAVSSIDVCISMQLATAVLFTIIF